MSDPRTELLRRVTNAVSHLPPAPAAARSYRRHGRLDDERRAALFCERVGEYRAGVRRLGTAAVPAAIAEICADVGARKLGVPRGLPSGLRPPGVELVDDHGLTPRELDRLDGALTGCTAAVAETGTIILTAAPHEGRRALTLVPDLHICIVGEKQIKQLLPEALALVDHRWPVTLVSGPSATSDIELSRVEGVHGPRNLHVLVVKETP
jgi:L-lactate dehydrogenase complex protein LldG